jgi:hypothetical protein
MTVYVDDLRMPATVGRLRARWSHLFTDQPDQAELHELASRIGLRRTWFQATASYPHYDVTDTKRRQAITAGAVPITWRETGRIIHRVRAATTTTTTGGGQ